MAILPIENLAADPATVVDAGAIQLAVWDSLQAQPAWHAVMASHRRDLPELTPAHVLEGYVAANRFQLRLDNEPVSCAGTLADCVPQLVGEIARRLGVTPRAAPKVETLRILAGRGLSGHPADSLEKAVQLDSRFSLAWLAWAAQAQLQAGIPAALAALSGAPLESMPAFDAARIRVRQAELRQDRKAHSQALVQLAAHSPADIDLQNQAAQLAAATRDFAAAAKIYDRLIAATPHPQFLNQAAYLAAFMGDRGKAERLAASAEAAAPNNPTYIDTRGEIAYFFADFAAASRYFEQAAGLNVAFINGQALWEAADAARNAGDKSRANGLLSRYLEYGKRAGLRNTLVLQSVWEWRGDAPESAILKVKAAADSMERGKALFLLALMALNRKDYTSAQGYQRQLEPNSVEAAFLNSVMDGTPPPPNIPFPPEAMMALHHYVRGNNDAARAAFAVAKPKIDPFAEGQWRKFEAILDGRKPQGLLPASPDDWLAVLLR